MSVPKITRGNDFITREVTRIKEEINNKQPTATKFQTYRTLNPTLEIHPLYTKSAPTIPDYLRITFTRYRLSSHQLRIEVGRWSRTPPDQRMCSCNTGIQNEFHIFHCPIVQDVFTNSDKTFSSPTDIFTETSAEDLRILHKVLNRLYLEKEQTEVSD